MIAAIGVTVTGRRIAHAQRNTGTKQNAYASPVVENGSVDELTNYTTLGQGVTMEYITVSSTDGGNQGAHGTASIREAQFTGNSYDNIAASIQQSTRNSQNVYDEINDGYEMPQRQF